ncbi:hypothetical protein [Burkholderia cepacia]|uniref:hypothetical protein n=1 Tax=Burkholderia cepacia TaxID=292 RepID=UPI0035287EC7
MSAASNARQANKTSETSETSATDARRSGDPHTVTPTRPRVRAAKPASRDARRPAGRGSGGSSGSSGPVAAHDGDRKGNPLWEDDGGAMPPEEWS